MSTRESGPRDPWAIFPVAKDSPTGDVDRALLDGNAWLVMMNERSREAWTHYR